MRCNFQQIVYYCLGLCTKTPGLRKVDLEPSPRWTNDKINTLKQRRNTQKKASCITQPAFTYSTHIWIPAPREVDVEASPKRGTNRTKALVSIYWPFQSLHVKQSSNQISHKFPNPMLFSMSKETFPKIPNQLLPMTRVMSGVATRKDETRSNPLARE